METEGVDAGMPSMVESEGESLEELEGDKTELSESMSPCQKLMPEEWEFHSLASSCERVQFASIEREEKKKRDGFRVCLTVKRACE